MTFHSLHFYCFTTWGELPEIPRTGADYIFPRLDDLAGSKIDAGENELSGLKDGLATGNNHRQAMSFLDRLNIYNIVFLPYSVRPLKIKLL